MPLKRGRGRPKTLSDSEQRKLIAEVAWNLFLKLGYAKTTMMLVAETGKVSLRTVYRLFPGKIDLFAEVVGRHRLSMVALPGNYEGLPSEEALARIFQLDLDVESDTRRSAFLALVITESRKFPELLPIFKKHGGDEAVALLESWLARQNNLGNMVVPDARTAARMLMDIAFGAIVLKDQGPQWPGQDDRDNYLRTCFLMLSRGFNPRGKASL